MRIDLKIAIIRSRKSQRQVGLEAQIPETRLSELVRGRGVPTPIERNALRRVLGADYFSHERAGV